MTAPRHVRRPARLAPRPVAPTPMQWLCLAEAVGGTLQRHRDGWGRLATGAPRFGDGTIEIAAAMGLVDFDGARVWATREGRDWLARHPLDPDLADATLADARELTLRHARAL